MMVVSADVYRPAAIEQLKTLAAEVQAEFFPSNPQQKPIQIVNDAIKAAKNNLLMYSLLILLVVCISMAK